MNNDSTSKSESDDQNITNAADKAHELIQDVLSTLPEAKNFDYSGHVLAIGEYDVCKKCTVPIAEAQQVFKAILLKAGHEEDPNVAEHLEIAAELLKAEAKAAEIRAQLHNGQHSEKIVNSLLGFIHDRKIFDEYGHSHSGE